MDGKKGGCICNKKFTFTQLEKKKSGGVSVVASLLPYSTGVTQCSAPNKLLSGTRTRAGRDNQGLHLYLFAHSKQKHNPCPREDLFCVRTDTLLFAAHKKGFAKNKA